MDGIWQNGRFVLQSTLEDKINQLENDCKVMVLRLYGESDDTFSPECYEVMKRWRPKCLNIIHNNSLHGTR